MDFQEMLKNYHPELYNRQFTEQYALSEKILDYLFDYNLSQEQMADMMELDFDLYLKMECGWDSIPVRTYQEAIRLFEVRVK